MPVTELEDAQELYDWEQASCDWDRQLDEAAVTVRPYQRRSIKGEVHQVGGHTRRDPPGGEEDVAVETDPDERKFLERRRDKLLQRMVANDMESLDTYQTGDLAFKDGRYAMVWSWAPLAPARDPQIAAVIKQASFDPETLENWVTVNGVRMTNYESAFKEVIEAKGLHYYRVKDAVIVTPLADPSTGVILKLRNELWRKVKGKRISSHIYPLAGYKWRHTNDIEEYRRTIAKLGQGPGAGRQPPTPQPKPQLPILTHFGGRTWDAVPELPLQTAFGLPFAVTEAPMPEPKAVTATVRVWDRAVKKHMPVADMRALQTAVRELETLSKAFPNMITNVLLHPDSGEVQGRANGFSMNISLNSKWYLDPQQLYYSTAYSAYTGWHPRGTAPIAAVMTHEYGHLVQYFLERRAGFKGTTFAHPEAPKAATIINRWMPMITGRGLSDREERRLKQSTSQYATKGTADHEAFAEAFSGLRWNRRAEWSPAMVAMNGMFKELWTEVSAFMREE